MPITAAIAGALSWIAAHFWTIMKVIAIAGTAIAVGYGIYRYITVMHAPPVEQTFVAMAQLFPLMINFMVMSMFISVMQMFRELIRGVRVGRTE